MSSRRGALRKHHHDAVYVSEYRSASAGGRRRPRNSTDPTHAPKTRGPGNAGGVRLGRNTLSRPTRSKQRLGLTGGVHTSPGRLVRLFAHRTVAHFRSIFLSAKDAKDAKKAGTSQAAWAFHGGGHSDTCLRSVCVLSVPCGQDLFRLSDLKCVRWGRLQPRSSADGRRVRIADRVGSHRLAVCELRCRQRTTDNGQRTTDNRQPAATSRRHWPRARIARLRALRGWLRRAAR